MLSRNRYNTSAFRGREGEAPAEPGVILRLSRSFALPGCIFNVLLWCRGINAFVPRASGEMRIVLEKPGPNVEPPLKVKVEYSAEVAEADLPDLKKEIEAKMAAQLRVRPAITFVPPNTLERAAGPSAKGKLLEKLYEEKK